MTKVLSTLQFNKRNKKTVQELSNGTDPFIYIANEVYPERSFIVIAPEAFATLLRSSGFDDIAKDVSSIKDVVRAKFREKSGAYRKGLVNANTSN